MSDALSSLIEAAAQAMVAERCRQSYLHDLRGDLQALNSSVELLVRAASAAAPNAALAEKAAGLARKTLLHHEQSLAEILETMAPGIERESRIDLGDLAASAVKLLRGEASRHSVDLQAKVMRGAAIVTRARLCRSIINGLSVFCIDALPPGASLTVGASRMDAWAVIEWRASAALPATRIPAAEDCLPDGDSAFQVLVAATRRWVSAAGGRLVLPSQAPPGAENALTILYPAFSEP